MLVKDNAEIFHANADYMADEYGIRVGQEIELACDQLEATLKTNWNNEDWFEERSERWADIVTLPNGIILAVVADGEWGQPSTYTMR